MPDEVIVFVTCPSAESMKIAKPLVDEGLAACVNLLPEITSVFSWQGKVCTESEELLLIKSNRAHWQALEKRIKELHSYDIPEIICVPIEDGYQPYMKWLNAALRQ